MRTTLALAALLALASTAVMAQSTIYQQNGNITYGSDGSTAMRFGNTTFISPPASNYGQMPQRQRVCTTIGTQTICN